MFKSCFYTTFIIVAVPPLLYPGEHSVHIKQSPHLVTVILNHTTNLLPAAQQLPHCQHAVSVQKKKKSWWRSRTKICRKFYTHFIVNVILIVYLTLLNGFSAVARNIFSIYIQALAWCLYPYTKPLICRCISISMLIKIELIYLIQEFSTHRHTELWIWFDNCLLTSEQNPDHEFLIYTYIFFHNQFKCISDTERLYYGNFIAYTAIKRILLIELVVYKVLYPSYINSN